MSGDLSGRTTSHEHCWHGQGHPDESDPACCRCEDNPCRSGRVSSSEVHEPGCGCTTIHGCICVRQEGRVTKNDDGTYTWDIDPECEYHAYAARHPWDHRSPWNCPTYYDGCNCEEVDRDA